MEQDSALSTVSILKGLADNSQLIALCTTESGKRDSKAHSAVFSATDFGELALLRWKSKILLYVVQQNTKKDKFTLIQLYKIQQIIQGSPDYVGSPDHVR
ncbi:hypothetical protein AMQ83_25470 [Paenibacillus riograndensis]|nr:hypothetical protein AMQ83_25470 [Paenibacillus riograndensis]